MPDSKGRWPNAGTSLVACNQNQVTLVSVLCQGCPAEESQAASVSIGQNVCIRTKCTFFAHGHAFVLRPPDFPSRSRPRGTQAGRVCTRRKFGPRPGSVARALGVQSRANAQVITGWVSAEVEPCRTMETPTFQHVALILYSQ